MTSPRVKALRAIPVAWTPATDGALTAPVVLAPMVRERDFAKWKGQLRGKIVLVSKPERSSEPDVGAFQRLSDEELDTWFATDSTPDDPGEEKEFLAGGRKAADGCEESSGELLPHVGTAAAARDMDLMRQVLGDDRLRGLIQEVLLDEQEDPDVRMDCAEGLMHLGTPLARQALEEARAQTSNAELRQVIEETLDTLGPRS